MAIVLRGWFSLVVGHGLQIHREIVFSVVRFHLLRESGVNNNINNNRQCGRVVKAPDLKSGGLCPRGFKSHRCRNLIWEMLSLIHLKLLYHSVSTRRRHFLCRAKDEIPLFTELNVLRLGCNCITQRTLLFFPWCKGKELMYLSDQMWWYYDNDFQIQCFVTLL